MDPDILGAQDEDEAMMVSIELVTMVVTVASTLVGLAAGFGWVVARMDARFASAEQRADARFASAEQRADARFEGVEQRMDARFQEAQKRVDERFDRLGSDIAEVKVAIARLEGLPPRLLMAR